MEAFTRNNSGFLGPIQLYLELLDAEKSGERKKLQSLSAFFRQRVVISANLPHTTPSHLILHVVRPQSPGTEGQSILREADRILLRRLRTPDRRQPIPESPRHHGKPAPVSGLLSLSSAPKPRPLMLLW